MMFRRSLKIAELVAEKSLFLLGPRQTGKSTLLQTNFKDSLFVDLLHSKTFLDLSSNPSRLESLVTGRFGITPSSGSIVVIDEVQKLPELLNEVHRLIEKHKDLRFVLTGSSARKLRRTDINLLGGRARRIYFHPLVLEEATSKKFTADDALLRMLQIGGLPNVLQSKSPESELDDYVGLYLKEEIQNEALTRSIGNFSRFLKVAAASNTEQIIFSNIASDSQVPARTVREYFQILEDTLVGHLLPAFNEGSIRKPMTSPKFYLFDVGVANALSGRFLSAFDTAEFGKTFEHFVFCEIRAAIDYLQPNVELFYWRTTSKLEVDFVMLSRQGKLVAIEAKAKTHIGQKELTGLKAFSEEFHEARKIVVCREDSLRTVADGTEIFPVREFCERLWRGQFW